MKITKITIKEIKTVELRQLIRRIEIELDINGKNLFLSRKLKIATDELRGRK